MEIQKHGTKTLLTEEKKVKYNFKCQRCGCEFTCNSDELHLIERRLNGKRTAICPECGAECEYQYNQLL